MPMVIQREQKVVTTLDSKIFRSKDFLVKKPFKGYLPVDFYICRL